MRRIKMQAKLFVTDMDGTLLNNEHKISKGNKHMIKRAVEAGRKTYSYGTFRGSG